MCGKLDIINYRLCGPWKNWLDLSNRFPFAQMMTWFSSVGSCELASLLLTPIGLPYKTYLEREIGKQIRKEANTHTVLRWDWDSESFKLFGNFTQWGFSMVLIVLTPRTLEDCYICHKARNIMSETFFPK